MKNLIITLLMILSFQTTFAQHDAPSERVKKQISILKNSNLGLSEIQLTRITAVLISEDNIQVKNEQAFRENKPQLELKLKEIKEHRINNIKGAMTPQQVNKFDELRLAEKL